MKKQITAVIASALALMLWGCGEKESSSSSGEVSQIATEALSDTPVAAEVVQPFADYFDGFNNNDPDKVIASITPQVFIDGLKDAEKYDELRTQTEGDITTTMDYWKETYGDDPKATYMEEVSNRPLTEQQLFFAELCYKYTYYDIKVDLEIEEGYEVTFKYKTEGKTDSAEGEETACFVKVKGDGWKMIATHAGALNQYKDAEDPYKS